MARKKRTKKTVQVDSLKHKDKRTNIPTEELRDFVVQDEDSPKAMLYPRDPSLDPQLVWKGKDEQDGQDLEVPVVPVYIQEKVHPHAIVEDMRRRAGKAALDPQMTFFDDFNGIEDFEQKIDFYHHDANWSNRMILGDSLLVMTSLAEKEGLKGKVQMIYIDPPYGIKFASNWQVSTRKRDVKDGKAGDTTRQPEQVRAFRDTWELGIHSYLAYLRDRLVVARELLTETGSIFVQIGDENVHLVRCVLDEVFGSDNFCGLISFVTTGGVKELLLASRCDYLLWYARDIEHVKYRQLYLPKAIESGNVGTYSWLDLHDGIRRGMTSKEKANLSLLPPDAKVYRPSNITTQGNPVFEFEHHGRVYARSWKTTHQGMTRLAHADRLHIATNSLSSINYLDDFPVSEVTRLWTDTFLGSFAENKVYAVQTSRKTIERCLLMATDSGDLVLDPTCGSGTTAYVAEQWGRRWITMDTSRVALALARTRLMAARFAYYLLADSPDGVRKEAEITGQQPPAHRTGGDIKKGFVYERVPHITLKDIANSEEINEIHARWQEGLGPVREKLNRELKQKWEEWEVPREPGDKWSSQAKKLLDQWWELRQARQREIDASIARNADQELLYDRPYEDKKCVRVTGPFTVESLSPHRRLSVEEKREGTGRAEGLRIKEFGPDQFGTMIIENLKKAGVQNRVRQERLKFDTLEPYAGEWIHAVGEYTQRPENPHPGPLPEGEGVRKRVAVCIGPEHGTVGPELLKEAAKEAVQGVGFDLLAVCGFAFDPHVDEEARRYGKLEVLVCRMNPDLSMGDELLKKTGAGNLFMIFGEPDISIDRDDKGQVVVEIHGLDVYDPTTGQIRSESTDDIACWFIDTDYDGESFFVRHAYFTGADEPYDKLKRALRAEIDEAAWSALYSTKSQPFDPPETGKIAVKVINHYGDEVLKVYEVKSQ